MTISGESRKDLPVIMKTIAEKLGVSISTGSRSTGSRSTGSRSTGSRSMEDGYKTSPEMVAKKRWVIPGLSGY